MTITIAPISDTTDITFEVELRTCRYKARIGQQGRHWVMTYGKLGGNQNGCLLGSAKLSWQKALERALVISDGWHS